MRIRIVLAAAAVVLVGLLTASPASAQYTGGTPPQAGPVAGPVAKAPVAPTPVQVVRAQPRPGRLALTGGDIAQLALLAGGLVLGGAVIVRRSRRRLATRLS